MMRLVFRYVFAVSLLCIAPLALPFSLLSQESVSGPATVAAADLPEAPAPLVITPVEEAQTQPAAAQAAPAQPPAQTAPAAQGTSSSQPAAQETDAQKSASQTAADQLKQQESQRVMGVMATFNTTTNKNALPLSPGQKFQLFFKSSTDPWPFALAGVVSGIGQAENSYPEWGQGMQGYGKRYGAAYTDSFIGNFFGNAVLPTILHEDPRYFQMGTGNKVKRLLWAASSSFWCRRDNGKWGPNYANVGGNLIGAAIARAYYPESDRTVGSTISDGLTVSVEGIAGAEVIEFWPDLARHMKRKREEKLARQAAQAAAQNKTQTPSPDDTKK